MKICNKCKINLDLSNFRICKYANGNIYYKSFCKDCERKNAKSYANLHKEERKKYSKNFITQNPEYKKNWRKNNKEKINQQERVRRANDIQFKLKKIFLGLFLILLIKGGLHLLNIYHIPYKN